MNRRDRDRYDRDYDNYNHDYSGGTGYSRNDEHYHSARNLTNEFEREYQSHHRGMDRDNYSPNRTGMRQSYHEGDMGGAYERMREGRGAVRSDTSYKFIRGERDADSSGNYGRDNYSSNRDNYRNNQSSYSGNRGNYDRYQDDDSRSQRMYGSSSDMGSGQQGRGSMNQGNLRRGYGISDYEGTSDRNNTLNSDQNRGGDYYGGSGMGNRGSRFGGGSMGESFPGSNRGVPDTTYGHRNFSDDEGTGMGSTYGGQNYGGGTGYSGGHRGGSFGNSTYGTSAGNYGGYGSMGGGTYGGRSSSGWGDTSHNSDRGTRELGGL